MINNSNHNEKQENENREHGKQLSLYLHIPFCVRKCYYCDFLSFATTEETQVQYVQALKREIALQGKQYDHYHVDSIFIGGGTPSVLPIELMDSIMKIVRHSFQIDVDAEVTIEVNPGTVDDEKLNGYRALGINRLSIGLQSASDEELRRIGRIHTYEEFMHTYQTARQAGYGNMNVDLMSGLPGQTLTSYEETLQKVIALKPEHISAYSLIVEEGTPFWTIYGEDEKTQKTKKSPMPLPGEDVERAMYELTKEKLEHFGYDRYEISNYAKKGYESRHNIGYWKRHNYLGLGLGSSSLIQNQRWKNTSDLKCYMKTMGNCQAEEIQSLTKAEQMEEFMFLGLRLMKGISYGEFESCFQIPIMQVYERQIKKGIQEGLLLEYEEQNQTFLRLTSRGIDVSNVVMAEFLF